METGTDKLSRLAKAMLLKEKEWKFKVKAFLVLPPNLQLTVSHY